MAEVTFTIPPNPGIYPAGLAANAAAGTRARAEVEEHKEEVAQYEILKGVEQALKDIILETVENDYLMEIEGDTLGFLNQTPRQMIDHLKARGGALDFADTKTLLTERDSQVYFNRVENAVKALTRAGITSDMNERRDMRKCVNGKTRQQWTKGGSTSKHSLQRNINKQITVKQFKANLIKEQAEATEELIATLAEKHTRKMETLIKSTTDAMKEMMQLIKSNATTPTNPTKLLDEEKKKKRDEKQKKYNEAPICAHCGKKTWQPGKVVSN
jgi:hypothetical protein